MSEPTIKPKHMSCEVHGMFRSGASNCPMCKPLYTHDDLVAVAREAQEAVWVKDSYDHGPTAVFDESPEHIVERLTGVKR
jgi:hypothetical protein